MWDLTTSTLFHFLTSSQILLWKHFIHFPLISSVIINLTPWTVSVLLLREVRQLRGWFAACGWRCTHSVGTARWYSWEIGGQVPGSLCPRCQVRAGCTPCSSTSNNLHRMPTTCSTRSSLHPLQTHIQIKKQTLSEHTHTAAQTDSLQTHISAQRETRLIGEHAEQFQ